ncbi:hypothetical protein [Dolichospermum sp. UHCC 0259]|nr:hypothetical protein [Dolichospermum sp. UHCC 0259]
MAEAWRKRRYETVLGFLPKDELPDSYVVYFAPQIYLVILILSQLV